VKCNLDLVGMRADLHAMLMFCNVMMRCCVSENFSFGLGTLQFGYVILKLLREFICNRDGFNEIVYKNKVDMF
jgi:hypothetical protein